MQTVVLFGADFCAEFSSYQANGQKNEQYYALKYGLRSCNLNLMYKKVAHLIAVLEVEEDDVIDVFGDDACNRARSEELL